MSTLLASDWSYFDFHPCVNFKTLPSLEKEHLVSPPLSLSLCATFSFPELYLAVMSPFLFMLRKAFRTQNHSVHSHLTHQNSLSIVK